MPKMNVNLYVIEDYRKKDDFVVRINKPNFQNAKNERKLTYNKGLQKKRCFSIQKNKPKQTQFYLPPKGGRTDVRCRMSEIMGLWQLQFMAHSGTMTPVNRVRVSLAEMPDRKFQLNEILGVKKV